LCVLALLQNGSSHLIASPQTREQDWSHEIAHYIKKLKA